MGDIILLEGDNILNVALTPIPLPMANLLGVVTDAKIGNPLSGVKITINGLITHTDTDGVYAFVDLVPGSYVVTFEKEGYGTEVR